MDPFPKVSNLSKKCRKRAVLERKKKIYNCEICDYTSSHKSHYDKHLKSKKHQKGISKKFPNGSKKGAVFYKCIYCDRKYKTNSGFWKHSQKCQKNLNVKEALKEVYNEAKEDKLMEMILKQQEKIDGCEKAHEALQENCVDKLEKVASLLKNSQSIQNTTNNIQKQENYNTININIFLNEHCKNAMNLQDFVDKIKYKLEDVMSINQLGYEKGMANVMLKNLKDMPITERPIHCSDSKKGVFHVKDEGEWQKEENGLVPGSKTYAIAKQLRTKGILAIQEWEAANPNWPYDEQLGKERLCLFDILAGGCDAKELEISHIEFLKKVGDEVKIEDVIKEVN